MRSSSYLLLCGAALGLASCNAISSIQKPLGMGIFDPLKGPGSQSDAAEEPFAPFLAVSYTPGQWIETSMPNSTFFRAISKGDATADKVLQVGTPLKYISTMGSYVKVELDSGDVGFVPEIMVTGRVAVEDVPIIPPPLAPLEALASPEDGFVPIAPGERPDFDDPSLPPVVPESATLPEAPAPPRVDGITD